MNTVLLDKASELQSAVNSLNVRYKQITNELATLKSRPDNEPIYKQTIGQLENRLANLTNEFEELTSVHAQTSKQAQELIKQNNKLAKTIEELTEENTLLRQKNRTAIERAELVQEWLKNIDNGTA